MAKVRERVKTQGVGHPPILGMFTLHEVLKHYHSLSTMAANQTPGAVSKTQRTAMLLGMAAISSSYQHWGLRDRIDFQIEYDNWKGIHNL